MSLENFFAKKLCVLIINDNGLGDYILIRNYLPYFKISEKYKNHKIIFLAKSDRIDLLKRYDKKYIDIVLPFSPTDFSNDIDYQNKIIGKLNAYNITDIINIGCAYPSVDKEPESTIKICRSVNAQNKIAHVIEPTNEELKQKYDIYTKVIYTPNKDLYEFERNKLFFEKLLNVKIIEKTLPSFNIKKNKKENYIGIAPFKRDGYISWNINKWAELIKLAAEKNKYNKIVLIGCKNDSKHLKELTSRVKNKAQIINNIGKCTSAQLPELIASLKLLISAETSTVHIASAVGTAVLCLSNGGFYKRFQPVPAENIKYIYPEEFENIKDKDFDENTINPYCYISPYNLSKVDVNSVYAKISELL